MKHVTPFVAALAILACGAAAQDFQRRAPEFLPADHVFYPPLAAGDLDGDGDRDLVVRHTGGLRLLSNDGEGRLAERLFVANGTAAANLFSFACAVIVDVDGDGDQDLVLGRSGHPTEPTDLLLRNDGNWVFTDVSAAQMPATTDVTRDMWPLDIDADGDVDIACANAANCVLQIVCPRPATLLRNNGSGTFTSEVISSPSHHWSVVGGDFDGDGDLDLAFGYGQVFPANPDPFRLFLNQGGTLVETFGHTTGGLAPVLRIATADADGDGDLDVFSESWGQSPASPLQLFLNQGSATFVAATNLPGITVAQGYLADFVVGDLDSDGDPDVMLQESGQNHQRLPPRLWRNQGGAVFADVPAALDFAGFWDTLLADFDGDLDLDAYLVWETGDGIAWNDGLGIMSELEWATSRWASARAHATLDVDGDGKFDLLACELHYGGNRVVWMRGDGYGNFAAPRVLLDLRGTALTSQLLPADFDLDGDEDLYVVNSGPGTAGVFPSDQLLRNDGGGVFTDVSATALPQIVEAGALALVVDFDGDGLLDVWLADSPQDRLLLNQGNLLFIDATATHLPTDTQSTLGMATLDIDGDGDLDAALAAYVNIVERDPLRLLINNGAGVLQYATGGVPPLLGGGKDLAVGDFDGDGDPDIVVSLSSIISPYAAFLRNDGGTFVDDTAARMPTANRVDRLHAVDTDFDGDLDVVASYVDGQATLLGRYLNTGAGVFQWQPAYGGIGTPTTEPLTGDFDRDGDLDIAMVEGVFFGAQRELHNALPPRLGMHGELKIVSRGGNGVDPQIVGIAIASRLAVPRRPLGSLGELLLDPAVAFLQSIHSLPGSGGSARVRYRVPNDPSFLHFELYAQGFFLHTPHPSTWRSGNLTRMHVVL